MVRARLELSSWPPLALSTVIVHGTDLTSFMLYEMFDPGIEKGRMVQLGDMREPSRRGGALLAHASGSAIVF